MEKEHRIPDFGLEYLGLHTVKKVHWNLSVPVLYEFALRNAEGQLAADGPLAVTTGEHTGRAAQDRYIVEEPSSRDDIWWGKANVGYPEDRFNGLKKRMIDYLQDKELFVQDCYVGADPDYRYPVRIITAHAWHSIFARNMFLPI